MKETTYDINTHKFQRFFIDYFGMRPANAPISCRREAFSDIADVLEEVKKGCAGDVILDAGTEPFLFELYSRRRKRIALRANNGGGGLFAKGKPESLEVVMHPNPDLSYATLSGNWNLEFFEQEPAVTKKTKYTSQLYLRPHSAIGLHLLNDPAEAGLSRSEVMEKISELFFRNIYFATEKQINGFIGAEVYMHAHADLAINDDDFWPKTPYTSFPVIEWAVCFKSTLTDGNHIEKFTKEMVRKTFNMPAYLQTKHEEGKCVFSLMFEVP
ncbi:hypothetical protein KY329_00810 [Candidatus Woesearchaeota archaeon]|nr:hypothetical protein [Candidatus Woesearchaeota archaeon]